MSDEVIAEESVVDAEVLAADESAAVEHDIDALLAERDEYKDIALRLQADFENYRKRVAQQSTTMSTAQRGRSPKHCSRFSMRAKQRSRTVWTVSSPSGRH